MFPAMRNIQTILCVCALTACGGNSSTPGNDAGSNPNDGGGNSTDGGTTDGAVTANDAGVDAAPFDAGPPQECPTLTAETTGTHVRFRVSWPASGVIMAGESDVDVWSMSKINYGANGAITGESRACGSVIPAFTPLIGDKIQPQIPDAAWENAAMPGKTPGTGYPTTGMSSGFATTSTVRIAPFATVLGVNLANPVSDAWPNFAAARAAQRDHDGNSRPGIAGVPRSDTGFALPPTSFLALANDGLRADMLDLATRITVEVQGTRTSCTEISGVATVSAFNSHIIGCHKANGEECTETEASFVDTNGPTFSITGPGTYTTIHMSDNATCAELRTMLPPG
jgi:hypothetical protein